MLTKRHFVPAVLLTFVLLAVGSYAQTFSVLYNFGNAAGDPTNPGPEGVIALGRDGALYSTSEIGFNITGYGPMFKITSAGAMTEPFNFNSDTGPSSSGLTLATDGNFYGATLNGTGNNGIVYRLTPAGTLTTLHTFSGADGTNPLAPPTQGSDGNLYGTVTQGGTNSCGVVYKLTLSGTFTVLYQFDGTHGCYPYAQMVQGTDGNFYGTTVLGGPSDLGVIFKITPVGKLTVLHNFDSSFGAPQSPLIQASDGNFYGTAPGGGEFAGGAVFKITPAGKFSVLHGLNGTTDGYSPLGGLVQATDGNFYGTANEGGTVITSSCSLGCGTIFRVTPAGVFTVLYNFDGTTGELPEVSLIQHTNGILYGDTTYGGTGGSGQGCTPGNCGVFYSVNIGAAPFVTFVGPAVAKVGKTVEILGQGFTGTTAVTFGSTAASFRVSSGSYLTATVPAGATTGAVTVTTPSGTLTSNKIFRVTPQTTSFSPPSGTVGTPVTITGVSLTQTTKVTFGGVAATAFTVNSDTQVTATVPTGAVTGKIVVTTPGGTASSATNFTVN